MPDNYSIAQVVADIQHAALIRVFGRLVEGVPTIKLARIKAFSVAGHCTRISNNEWPIVVVPDDGHDPQGDCGFNLPDKVWHLDPRSTLTLLRPESGPAEKVLGISHASCGCGEKSATPAGVTRDDDCVSVAIKDEQACIDVAHIGHVCVPAPGFPDGTVAEVCIHFCTFGTRVYAKVLGNQVGCVSIGRGCGC